MRLKKNVVSVDFHVGQYAKIVEGMKRELDEWKAKAGALAEVNGRLKEELQQIFRYIIDNPRLGANYNSQNSI